VNALRKLHGKKGIHDAAKALIAKWKNMVVEEDDSGQEETEASSQTNDLGPSGYTPSQNQPKDHAYSPENRFSGTVANTDHYSPSKEKHSPNGYSPGAPSINGVEVFCYSPSKKKEKRKSEHSEESHNSSSGKNKSSRSQSSSSSHHKKSSHHESSHKSSTHSSKSSSSSKTSKSDSKVKHKASDSDTDAGLASSSGKCNLSIEVAKYGG